MDIARDSYSPNTNIYKYVASMKYILGSKIIDIPMENIKKSPYCTYENNDLFFSKKIKIFCFFASRKIFIFFL